MEKVAEVGKDEDQIELPPEFRFHPTDEELITHYLLKKVMEVNFSTKAIGEADLNKSEPWELPAMAKMGENPWYFFFTKDMKYRTGTRTNRATKKGYWKETGKGKKIRRERSLIGMKKTLVSYRGRAPNGEKTKTNWVMHEYRLDSKLSHRILPNTEKGTGKRRIILWLTNTNPFVLPPSEPATATPHQRRTVSAAINPQDGDGDHHIRASDKVHPHPKRSRAVMERRIGPTGDVP